MKEGSGIMEKYVYKGKDEHAVLNEALKDLGVTINEVLTKTSEEKKDICHNGSIADNRSGISLSCKDSQT